MARVVRVPTAIPVETFLYKCDLMSLLKASVPSDRLLRFLLEIFGKMQYFALNRKYW